MCVVACSHASLCVCARVCVCVCVYVRVYASRSDRHIIIMDKRAPIINPNYMVLFDENDTFHVREVWDDRYNATFNSSIHDYTMEISEDGKSAGVSVCCTCFRRIHQEGALLRYSTLKEPDLL